MTASGGNGCEAIGVHFFVPLLNYSAPRFHQYTKLLREVQRNVGDSNSKLGVEQRFCGGEFLERDNPKQNDQQEKENAEGKLQENVERTHRL